MRARSVSPDVAGEPEVDRRPPAEVQRLVVDLDDRLPRRQERVVREVGAQHEQQVAVGQRLGGAAPPQQAGHPDRGRVVGLEHVLAAVGERDGGLQGLGQAQHLVARLPGALAAVDDDLLRAGEISSTALARAASVGRLTGRSVSTGWRSISCSTVWAATSPGHDHHAHAALEDRRLQGQLGDARHLAGGGQQGAVVRAAGEDRLGVGLLEVAAADLGARDVRRDGEHRRPVALAVVEPVDQVQAARSGRPEHGGRSAGDLRVGAGREGPRLLVAHVDELDVRLVPPQRVDDRVRRVADDAVHLADPGLDHLVDEDLCHRLGHGCAPVLAGLGGRATA